MKIWLALLFAMVGFLTHAQNIGPIYMIKAARLLDVASGQIRPNQSILVQGKFIMSVGSDLPHNSGAQAIDLGDVTLLPGLIDCHTHLTIDFDPGWENRAAKELPANWALRGARNARRTLLAGFTTVRDLGGHGFADVALADAIAQGWVEGPRVFPAGHPISISGGHGDVTGFAPGVLEQTPESGVADGPEQVLKAVRYQIKHGAKVIKIMATAGVLSFEGQVGAQQYSEEEMRVIVQEAHRHGIKVAAHAHGTEGIRAALRAGVDSIEHGTLIDAEGIALMKERGAWLCPTLYVHEYLVAHSQLPPPIQAKFNQIDAMRKDFERKVIPSGVKIAFGTDAGVYPHGQNAGEFAQLVSFGLTPLQAIQTATIGASELLDQRQRLGTIDKGKFADLIAVRGNPLQDVNVLTNVVFVMKEGVIYKGGAQNR